MKFIACRMKIESGSGIGGSNEDMLHKTMKIWIISAFKSFLPYSRIFYILIYILEYLISW